jgi:transposase-like protein
VLSSNIVVYASSALDVEAKIKDRLANDHGIMSIARELGVGISTVMRVKRQEGDK